MTLWGVAVEPSIRTTGFPRLEKEVTQVDSEELFVAFLCENSCVPFSVLQDDDLRRARSFSASLWESGISILIVSVCEFVPLFRPQGFHCNDPDLSHKYIGEKITNAALLIAAFVLPLFI
ncbi:unnamed protein product, partial [Nesidiocoris tenuis]